MKYQSSDPAAVRTGVLRQRAIDAEVQAIEAEIDAAVAETLAPNDEMVRDQLESTQALATERRKRARRRARRAEIPPSKLKAVRAAWLGDYLRRIEEEHASIGAILEELEEDGDEDQQADPLRTRQKVLEAAHAAATERRAPAKKPASKAAATKRPKAKGRKR